MRQLGLARAKERPTVPTADELSGGITLRDYQERILPALAKISLMT